MEQRSESEEEPTAESIWAYRDDVAALALRLCRDADRAEDVAHNALLRAAVNRRGGDAGDLRRWLHRMAALECLAARRIRRDPSLDALVESALESPLPDEPILDDAAIAAETDVIRAVLEAVEHLPERSRTALILRDGAGAPLDEVASVLGTTPGGAKALVHRARAAIRKSLPRTL